MKKTSGKLKLFWFISLIWLNWFFWWFQIWIVKTNQQRSFSQSSLSVWAPHAGCHRRTAAAVARRIQIACQKKQGKKERSKNLDHENQTFHEIWNLLEKLVRSTNHVPRPEKKQIVLFIANNTMYTFSCSDTHLCICKDSCILRYDYLRVWISREEVCHFRKYDKWMFLNPDNGCRVSDWHSMHKMLTRSLKN